MNIAIQRRGSRCFGFEQIVKQWPQTRYIVVMAPHKTISVEAFLSEFPEGIIETGERLRSIVRGTLPDCIERVYPGWRLIGYRVPTGSKSRYIGFIAPFADRIMLGFEHGRLLTDPDGILQGDHLKHVRYVEFKSVDEIEDDAIRRVVLEAGMLALEQGRATRNR